MRFVFLAGFLAQDSLKLFGCSLQVFAGRVFCQGCVGFLDLLPNLIGPVLTCASLVVPQAILQESFLSFLGIGIQAPTPSLGRLAAEGVEAVNTFVAYWWLIVFPCGVLVSALAALNFVADALRDRLDPTSGVRQAPA